MFEVEILVIALACAAVHLVSPTIARRLPAPERFEAFSSGLAVTYVFAHLLPELDEGHEVVGTRIYLFALVGFLVFFGLRLVLDELSGESEGRGRYAVGVITAMIYSALLVFTLGTNLPNTSTMLAVFVLGLCLHLLSDDIDAAHAFGDRWRRQGRFLVASAALAGFGLSLVRRPREVYVDILTALLAGFMLFTVFHEDVPTIERRRFHFFLLGIVVFAVGHFVLGG